MARDVEHRVLLGRCFDAMLAKGSTGGLAKRIVGETTPEGYRMGRGVGTSVKAAVSRGHKQLIV